MANNYTHATIFPDLPAKLFTAEELRALEGACGLTADQDDDSLYFYAELCFCERGEDEDGFGVDCEALFQDKLRQLDPVEYPHIAIQGAFTCDKMRPDEFGGFAIFITRDAIRSISTSQWLHEQTQLDTSVPAETH